MSEIWLLSAKPNIAVVPQISMNVDFISNGTVFNKIYIGYSYGYNDEGAVVYVGNRLKYDNLVVLSTVNGEPKTFTDEAYRTLIFYTSPTGNLLTWLQANADKQVDTEYLTRKSELTSVADAIRAKGGTSAQLVYPAGFVSAIQTIQTGITPQLIVTTRVGATVTATKGSKTVSGTVGADGTCTLVLSEAGEWSVTAVLGANTRTETVLIGTQNADLMLFKDAFAENDWETIIAVCQSGSIPSTWAVGDSKTMTINDTDYQIDIIGKSHDDYADGSGTAPLTFQLHDCYSEAKQMYSTNLSGLGWKNTDMRLTYLPAILALMPAEVQNGIRAVNKKTSEGGNSTTIETVSDTLFLLSEVEIFGTASSSVAGEGSQYDYYKAGNPKIKKREGVDEFWWERSSASGGMFCRVRANGQAGASDASSSLGVSFAFCF